MTWRDMVKAAMRGVGFDITRTKNVPACTFLGLQDMGVQMVLDVGANVGQFARYCRRMFPGAAMHCFEPLPDAARELREWVQKDRHAGQLNVWEFALGSEPGTATILEHVDHSSSSSLLPSTQRSDRMFPFTQRQVPRQIRVETLDGWVSEQGVVVDARTLLKLDVQGFEAHVMRGGKATLGKIGICIVEITPIPLYQQQASFSEIVALLSDAGLHYLGNLDQLHDEKGLPVYMDAVFVRPELLVAEL